LLKSSLLLREIAERIKVELLRSMEEFLVRKPDKLGVSAVKFYCTYPPGGPHVSKVSNFVLNF
jgi:hypothetical protein